MKKGGTGRIGGDGGTGCGSPGLAIPRGGMQWESAAVARTVALVAMVVTTATAMLESMTAVALAVAAAATAARHRKATAGCNTPHQTYTAQLIGQVPDSVNRPQGTPAAGHG